MVFLFKKYLKLNNLAASQETAFFVLLKIFIKWK